MLLLHRILSEFSAKNVAKLFPLYDREQDDLLILMMKVNLLFLVFKICLQLSNIET
jgi:hypothetical protein